MIEDLLEAHARAEAAGFLASPVTLDGVPPPDAFAAFRPGVQFGPFRLDREIGRGGMGTVWFAERGDGRFDRRVGVKFLRIALTGRLALAWSRGERECLEPIPVWAYKVMARGAPQLRWIGGTSFLSESRVGYRALCKLPFPPELSAATRRSHVSLFRDGSAPSIR